MVCFQDKLTQQPTFQLFPLSYESAFQTSLDAGLGGTGTGRGPL